MNKETFIATVNHISESGINDIRLGDLFDRIDPSEKLKESEERETSLRNEIWALKSVVSQLERDKQTLEETSKQLSERFKAKLLGVYYVIDSFTHESTHRDKQVVVRSLKAVLGKMINEGDYLPFSFNDPYLPF